MKSVCLSRSQSNYRYCLPSFQSAETEIRRESSGEIEHFLTTKCYFYLRFANEYPVHISLILWLVLWIICWHAKLIYLKLVWLVLITNRFYHKPRIDLYQSLIPFQIFTMKMHGKKFISGLCSTALLSIESAWWNRLIFCIFQKWKSWYF